MVLIDEPLYERYLGQLLAGDFRGCKATLSQVLDSGTGIRDVYLGLFQRSLYEVGRRWERNLISVAIEHLATAITETLMGLAAPAVFATPSTEGTAVVACVPGELHSIGARMIADTMQLSGWNTHYLGANLPVADLASYVKKEAPALVALSISLRSHQPQIPNTVKAVRSAQPNVTIMVGGQGLGSDGPALAAREGVHWMVDILAVEDYLVRQRSAVTDDVPTLEAFLEERAELLFLRLDAVGLVTRANAFACRLLGFDPRGRSAGSLFLAFAESPDLGQLARAGRPSKLSLTDRDGVPRTLTVDVRSEGDGFLLFGQVDVGEVLTGGTDHGRARLRDRPLEPRAQSPTA